jgi:precorrin-2 dehydrogenase/sirohydrochlorin ferrochelatase
MSLFPIFLKLDGRSCLVVGAGAVAESKIAGLIEAGAVVRVVAPRATPGIEQRAKGGELLWLPRAFELEDLDGVFLVVVATSSRELNEHIFREAQKRLTLCNVVDDPPYCDFYYPSVVRRGDLQFAISSAAHSPALAQRLRKEFDRQLEPEYTQWLVCLGRVRRGLYRRAMDSTLRRALLHRLASRERFEVFLQRSRSQQGRGIKAGVGHEG